MHQTIDVNIFVLHAYWIIMIACIMFHYQDITVKITKVLYWLKKHTTNLCIFTNNLEAIVDSLMQF